MQKRNCKSLEVQAEIKCGSGTSHLWKSCRTSAESGTLDLCQSRHSGSAGAELHIHVFGSQGRAECGSGTSHFWQSLQNESADKEIQIFGIQGRAEMRKRNIRSLAVKAE